MRLSKEEEYDLMLPESDAANMDSFKKILPYFFYDKESQKNIIKCLSPKTRGKTNNWLDEYLYLNKQRRSWYRISIGPSQDQGYKKYIVTLRDVFSYNMLSYEGTSPFGNLIFSVIDYDTYKSGQITVKKQKQKLFKYLLKNKIISQKESDSITTIRSSEADHILVCISRNPIDLLFASTGQNFSSCLSLDSDYPFYLGLPSLILDPNMCIIFVCSGKLKRRIIKGNEFKYFPYIGRTFAVMTRRGHTRAVRWFPHESWLNAVNILNTTFEKLRGKPIVDYIPEDVSMFHFKEAKFVDGTTARIYIDAFGIEYCDVDPNTGENIAGSVIHSSKGRCGTPPLDVGWSEGFESIESFEDICSTRLECVDCGERLYEDDTYYSSDGEPLCETCFRDSYFCCTYCGEAVHLDNEYRSGDDSESYCNHCFNELYWRCDICDNYVNAKNMTEIDTDEMVCSSCIGNHVHDCYECGKLFRRSDLIISGEEYLCTYCDEEIKIKEEETG